MVVKSVKGVAFKKMLEELKTRRHFSGVNLVDTASFLNFYESLVSEKDDESMEEISARLTLLKALFPAAYASVRIG